MRVNAYAAPAAGRAAGPHHHRAPGRRPERRPDRDRVRRHLPLRHPHRQRRLGPAALPRRPRPRDRRHRHRGRLRRHPAPGRRPGRRRLHGQLLRRVRQLPQRRRAVLPRGHGRHLRRHRPRRHHHPGRLLHPRRRRRRLRAARPRRHRPGRRRAAAVRRHHHLLAAAPLGRRARARRSPSSASAVSATWPSSSPHAMGAEVTVLSQSLKKQEDGLRLGADRLLRHQRPGHLRRAGRPRST